MFDLYVFIWLPFYSGMTLGGAGKNPNSSAGVNPCGLKRDLQLINEILFLLLLFRFIPRNNARKSKRREKKRRL